MSLFYICKHFIHNRPLSHGWNTVISNNIHTPEWMSDGSLPSQIILKPTKICSETHDAYERYDSTTQVINAPSPLGYWDEIKPLGCLSCFFGVQIILEYMSIIAYSYLQNSSFILINWHMSMFDGG